MIGHLYRYPHPLIEGQWVYVGQGPKRDKYHRNGSSAFGRRFKKRFPGVILPQPIREQIEVENQLRLNEEETIWMFRYHTWYHYPDGMNITFPGSDDYRNMGVIGGKLVGPANGRKAVESGHILKMWSYVPLKRKQEIGRIQGRKAAESGQIQAIGRANIRKAQASRSMELKQWTGYRNMTITNCLRWNIKRNKTCVCGEHNKETIG